MGEERGIVNIGRRKGCSRPQQPRFRARPPEETCAHHVLLDSLASLISLYNLGAGDVRRKEYRKAWIGYLIKIYKYINTY